MEMRNENIVKKLRCVRGTVNESEETDWSYVGENEERLVLSSHVPTTSGMFTISAHCSHRQKHQSCRSMDAAGMVGSNALPSAELH
jgi:hypothetical protein